MRPNTDTGIAPGRNRHALTEGFKTAFMTINACVFWAVHALACPSASRPLAEFPLLLKVTAPVPGQARIQLFAGNAATPITGFLGLKLDLDMIPVLRPTTTVAFRSANGWASHDQQFTTAASIDPVRQSVTFRFDRSDCAAVDGYGLLGELWLTGLDAGGNPEEWLRIRDGIVIEEIVIGARTAAASPGLGEVSLEDQLHPAIRTAPLEVATYPQPAGERVQVELASPGPARMALYDLQGHLLQDQVVTGTGAYEMDLSPYPGGTYLLRCHGADGQQAVRRIVHQQP